MPLNRPNMGEQVNPTRNSNVRLKKIMKILSWVKQKKSTPIDPEEMKRIITFLVQEKKNERKLRTECEKKLSKNINHQLNKIIEISKKEEELKRAAMQEEKERQLNIKNKRLLERKKVLSSSVTHTSTDTEGLTLKRKRKRLKRKKSIKKVKKPNRSVVKQQQSEKRLKRSKRKKRKKRKKSRKK